MPILLPREQPKSFRRTAGSGRKARMFRQPALSLRLQPTALLLPLLTAMSMFRLATSLLISVVFEFQLGKNFYPPEPEFTVMPQARLAKSRTFVVTTGGVS